MTDIECALALLKPHLPLFKSLAEDISAVTDANQNPGCGGDDLMTEKEWDCLRGVENALLMLSNLIEVLNKK